MRNFSDKICRGNQNTHFLFSNPPEKRTVYEIMRNNIVELGRPQVTIWRIRIACWVTKATHTHTHTHSQYVTPIAFPYQQWLQERASVFTFYVPYPSFFSSKISNSSLQSKDY